MQEAEKISPQKPKRITFWRLGFGGILLLLGLKNLDQRNIPADLVPSNLTQWFGFYLVTFTFIVAGTGLLIAGVQHLRLNRAE
jgi:hypothetical protein